MKLLFSFLALLMLNKECGQQKPVDTSMDSSTAERMQEHITIDYQESTRGFYEHIWISKDSITVTNDRSHIEKTSAPTPEKSWQELMEVLKQVDIPELPSLEAPTAMRHYDGARFTTLTVTQNGTATSTGSFDHGHPPKAIEALVNKVLTMKKLVPKK